MLLLSLLSFSRQNTYSTFDGHSHPTRTRHLDRIVAGQGLTLNQPWTLGELVPFHLHVHVPLCHWRFTFVFHLGVSPSNISPWRTTIGHTLICICTCRTAYLSECDVPVPGIPGAGNFSFCWWYRYRYRKILVREKVSEPASEKFGTGKKSRNRYRKNLVP